MRDLALLCQWSPVECWEMSFSEAAAWVEAQRGIAKARRG
jgi:hypothetical protein